MMEAVIENGNGQERPAEPAGPEAEPGHDMLDEGRKQTAAELAGPTATGGERRLLDDEVRRGFIDRQYGGFDHMGG